MGVNGGELDHRAAGGPGAGAAGGALTSLMHLIDQHNHFSSIIGKAPTPAGDAKSQHAKQWPEMYAGVNETARFLDLKADGAIIGQGMRKVPAIHRKPDQGLLLFWLTGCPNTLSHISLRSEWPLNLAKCSKHWGS